MDFLFSWTKASFHDHLYNKSYFVFSVCYPPIGKEEDEIRRERERVLKIFHEIEREIEQTCSGE